MRAKKGTMLYDLQKENIGKRAECSRCGKVKEVTVDHIIPKHLLEQFGLIDELVNWPQNFELVCLACNKFKADRVDLANPKTIPLLKMVIKKIEDEER